MSLKVGFLQIGGAAPIPTAVNYVTVGLSSTGSMVLTHGVPVQTVAGDVMILSLSGYSNEGLQGGGGSITVDPNWTHVVTLNNRRKTLRLYTKTADAADEAGTSSYSWTYTADGVTGRIIVTTVPQSYGTTVSAAVTSSGTSGSPSTGAVGPAVNLSASAPAGSWLYAVMISKEGRTDDDGNPLLACTNPEANSLVTSQGSAPTQGYHRHFSLPASVGTVTGTMAGSEDAFGALIVVGIS